MLRAEPISWRRLKLSIAEDPVKSRIRAAIAIGGRNEDHPALRIGHDSVRFGNRGAAAAILALEKHTKARQGRDLELKQIVIYIGPGQPLQRLRMALRAPK